MVVVLRMRWLVRRGSVAKKAERLVGGLNVTRHEQADAQSSQPSEAIIRGGMTGEGRNGGGGDWR